MRAAPILLTAMLALSGCATARDAYVEINGCPSGTDRAIAETLYFGTSLRGVEHVTEEKWRSFLATTVTPRFPDGLTWWRASGQWRNAAGEIEHEESFVLRIVHPVSAAPIAEVEAIRAAYRAQFDQEAVMVERVRTCVAF